MFQKRYIKIGSSTANDIQLSYSGIQPFHAILMQDTSGQVYLSLCVSGAEALLNGKRLTQTTEIFAEDVLQIGENSLAINDLFSWPKVDHKIKKQETENLLADNTVTKSGTSLQLILIYTAIAVLLVLIAFYV